MLPYVFLATALLAGLLHVLILGCAIWKGLAVFALSFLALNLLFVLFLAGVALFIDKNRPVQKQSAICRALCAGFADLVLCYSRVRAHVTGLELLPEEGRFVFVCNHRSGYDPIIVMSRLQRYNISFISKPSNLKIPLAGEVAHGAGFLSIDRENDRNALKSILQAADYIKRGICSVGIYPEGTRSKDGELLPFHAGSFKIAQKANAPLAIACIRGSEDVSHNLLRCPSDVALDILALLPAETVKAMSTPELAQYSRALIEQHLTAAAV